MKTLITLAAVALLAVTTFAQETATGISQQNHNTQQKSALTESDQLQIAVQKICPVTGQALGSMGEPVRSGLVNKSPTFAVQVARKRS